MNRPVILLVEDDSASADLARYCLEEGKIETEVVVARDGAEALDYLLGDALPGPGSPLRPSVILLDLSMPGIDGFEVLRRLRTDERTKLLPVVVLSSSNRREDIARSYRLGANSYIRKSANFDRFSEAMRQAAAYWIFLNEALGEEP